MRRVIEAAERHVHAILNHHREATDRLPEVMASAIAGICRSLPVTKIVAVTRGGFAARMVATRQASQPILAVSDDPQAARTFNLLPGTEGVFVDVPFSRTSTDHIAMCLEALWRRRKLDPDDLILVTAVSYPKSGNRMNLLQTHHVGDLVEALGWERRS